MNAWLGRLLQERGVDIFRMKGFLSIAGDRIGLFSRRSYAL